MSGNPSKSCLIIISLTVGRLIRRHGEDVSDVSDEVLESLLQPCPSVHVFTTMRLPVTIMSHSAQHPSPRPQVILEQLPQSVKLRPFESFQPYTHLRRGMDPTILLLSPVPLSLESTFDIYRDNKPSFAGTNYLLPDGIHQGQYRYVTSIAAAYWKTISENNGREFKLNLPSHVSLSLGSTEWTIVHQLSHREDISDHPVAEIRFIFEPYDPNYRNESSLKHEGKTPKVVTIFFILPPSLSCRDSGSFPIHSLSTASPPAPP